MEFEVAQAMNCFMITAVERPPTKSVIDAAGILGNFHYATVDNINKTEDGPNGAPISSNISGIPVESQYSHLSENIKVTDITSPNNMIDRPS